MSESNTVKIYACGGCGTNVAKYFETHRGKSTKGFADIEVCYIDTSMSNIDDIHPKNIFDNSIILLISYSPSFEPSGNT
jgi:hypothetical protein